MPTTQQVRFIAFARNLWTLALLLAPIGACASTASEPRVVSGFTIERIATIDGARELTVTPNGDLFVGTSGSDVILVQRAETAQPASPQTFVHFNDQPAAGVALSSDALFVGTQFGVYRIPYQTGDTRARTSPEKLASVRPSGVARDHRTTSVAWNGTTLYASVGSSCNGCEPDLDATRATIQRVDIQHHSISPVATRIRNAIALAIDPQSHALWAGVAGIDDLPPGQPYESSTTSPRTRCRSTMVGPVATTIGAFIRAGRETVRTRRCRLSCFPHTKRRSAPCFTPHHNTDGTHFRSDIVAARSSRFTDRGMDPETASPAIFRRAWCSSQCVATDRNGP